MHMVAGGQVRLRGSLYAAITASRAYQLTSRRTHASQEEPRLFARMAVGR